MPYGIIDLILVRLFINKAIQDLISDLLVNKCFLYSVAIVLFNLIDRKRGLKL